MKKKRTCEEEIEMANNTIKPKNETCFSNFRFLILSQPFWAQNRKNEALNKPTIDDVWTEDFSGIHHPNFEIGIHEEKIRILKPQSAKADLNES